MKIEKMWHRARSTVLIWMIAALLLPSFAAPPPVQAFPDAWWNESWDYRNVLAFNTSGLSENLTWFPVMVKFTAARFDFDKIEAGGADLRFIDKLSTDPLPYEIDYWNDTSEEGYVWVRVPQIAQSTAYSDYFWVYYGNAAATDAQDAVHVWGGPDVTVDNDTGIATGAPITIVGAGSTTVDVTQAGNLTVTLPVGGTGFAKTGDTANVTGSPVTLYPGDNIVVVEDTGNVTIEIGGYVAVYHMNDDATNSTLILDSTANNNTGVKGAAYATTAANIVNSTGVLAVSPTEVAAGTGNTTVAVTGAGTFNVTVPANQVLKVTVPAVGGVTSAVINDGTAGARVITVVGTGNFTAAWAVTAAPTEVAGVVGRAQQFVAASAQYITIGQAGFVPKSILTLVRPTFNAATQYIVSRYYDSTRLYVSVNRSAWGIGTGGTSVAITGPVIVDGQWVMIQGTYDYDAGGAALYTNTTVNTQAGASGAVTYTHALQVGRKHNNTTFYNGLIDELRLSSVARSAEWIEHENLAITDVLLYYGNEDPPPTVATEAASGLSMNAAGVTLGYFNGNITSLGGSPVCNASFQYGPTAAYGSQTALVEKNATGAYSAAIPADLTPGATYHFRGNATNVDGSGNGADANFTLTLPTIVTLAPTNVYMSATGTSATLRGQITNMGVATSATVSFEWGYTTAYGNTVGSQTASGIGTYTYTLTGFNPSNPVYYRFLSANGAVITYGIAKATSAAATTEQGYTILRLIPLLIIVATILLAWRQRENGALAVLSVVFFGVLLFLAISSILQSMW